eukprot:3968358-Amphidinium_carterae.1
MEGRGGAIRRLRLGVLASKMVVLDYCASQIVKAQPQAIIAARASASIVAKRRSHVIKDVQ